MEGVVAARVVTPDLVTGPVRVEVDERGSIAGIEETAERAPDWTLVPGFVDLQVNGIDDVDVAAASGPSWDRLDGLLLDQGVTTWCPTLVTAPLDRYAAPLERIREAADRDRAGRPTIAGAHLEGPFLGGAPGAHARSFVVAPDLAWIDALPGIVRMVTIAPEQPGAAEAIRRLSTRGVLVSLGHTTPRRADVEAAVTAGARLVTHLFNGMSGLHHREVGMVNLALTDDRLAVSLIADGVHVDTTALVVAARCKPADRLVLVSDAVAWRAGRVGAVRLVLRDGAPRLEDGTLAGSALTMDEAVRNVVGAAGWDLALAVRAASTTPATLLGLADRGAIEVGRRADLVALDADLRVAAVWVAGQRVR